MENEKRSLDLSIRQKKFCKNLYLSWKKAESAVKAWYSKRSAPAIASDLLQKPAIIAELERLQLPAIKKLELFMNWGTSDDKVKHEIQLRAVENILDRTGI